MLLVGTTKALWDLDRSYAIPDGVCVCALAANGDSAWALLDHERIERVGEFDLDPVAAIVPPEGGSPPQPMAAFD